ncbi:MAG: bifunctional 3-demethylubiquinol 3-O-methyltransferase/2-polyprenyl-6-hydroxyphenol methylase [Alphaproteobacteria bacterium CG_4_10_14_0_8_um_filter_53_9]|nr:MAG: bifunctional 3-demethylubiquinol 3-O-methyltransferase/2-polyprenyl-6-hydroxyphenol methylase [Alphaproteobacteria bacterium CG_4_10_14_0_8_um_filter_53_9]
MLRKDRWREGGTADGAEVTKFNALAEEWRRPAGRFAVAQAFHKGRMAWMLEVLSERFGPRFTDVTALDVGCATGLASEDLARAGAKVHGVDAAARNISIAKACAEKLPEKVRERVRYEHVLPENITEKYDVVLALEVVEHVADSKAFFKACAARRASGGVLVMATINRTWLSFIMAIVGAEYILRWLPRGTHAWGKFIKPEEIETWARAEGLVAVARCGMKLDVWRRQWVPCRSEAVNYMLVLGEV